MGPAGPSLARQGPGRGGPSPSRAETLSAREGGRRRPHKHASASRRVLRFAPDRLRPSGLRLAAAALRSQQVNARACPIGLVGAVLASRSTAPLRSDPTPSRLARSFGVPLCGRLRPRCGLRAGALRPRSRTRRALRRAADPGRGRIIARLVPKPKNTRVRFAPPRRFSPLSLPVPLRMRPRPSSSGPAGSPPDSRAVARPPHLLCGRAAALRSPKSPTSCPRMLPGVQYGVPPTSRRCRRVQVGLSRRCSGVPPCSIAPSGP